MAVAFCVLVLVMSEPVIEAVCVSLMTMVDVTSGAMIRVLVVNLAVSVVVVYAVTIGRLVKRAVLVERVDESVGESVGESVEARVGLIDDETEPQAWADPMPTVKGCVSTYSKSMKAVEAKKLLNWN